MAHFAVVAPAFYSHFNALEALGVELIKRGHRVTFLHRPDAVAFVRHPRVAFHALGADRFPAGSLAASLQRAANPGGPLGLRRVILDMARTTDMLCHALPPAIDELGIDAIIADQMEAAGALVAEGLGIPFISVACALPVNREPGLPLPVMPFAYADDERGRQMAEGSTRVYDWMMTPHRRSIEANARRFGLGARGALHECLSPLAQLSQTVPAFDFPRRALPPGFHHVGPLRCANARGDAPGSAMVPAISPRRPFVFASLGTLQGQRFGLFKRIALACRALDVQLLVAHCGGLDARQERALARHGATWVCDFADQQAVLARADAVVSHAGLNTVMDAIVAHTPILALPIAFDQPGAAARIVHAGIGLKASPRLASSATLRAHLERLLGQDSFAKRMQAMSASVTASGGAPRAATIVETALKLAPRESVMSSG